MAALGDAPNLSRFVGFSSSESLITRSRFLNMRCRGRTTGRLSGSSRDMLGEGSFSCDGDCDAGIALSGGLIAGTASAEETSRKVGSTDCDDSVLLSSLCTRFEMLD